MLDPHQAHMKHPIKNVNPHKRQDSLRKYAYYSGLGFQMAATIGIFTFIGLRIDEHRNADTPIWTAILALFGVTASIYLVIKSVTKKNNQP
jgi:F0F1-type ATP synthase assembly protein I